MDWKEFFKPTIVKLILTFSLFGVLVPVLKYPYMCEIPPCGHGLATIYRYLINYINDITNNIRFNNYIVGLDYFMLFIGLFFSYIISCLVLFGAKKLLNK